VEEICDEFAGDWRIASMKGYSEVELHANEPARITFWEDGTGQLVCGGESVILDVRYGETLEGLAAVTFRRPRSKGLAAVSGLGAIRGDGKLEGSAKIGGICLPGSGGSHHRIWMGDASSRRARARAAQRSFAVPLPRPRPRRRLAGGRSIASVQRPTRQGCGSSDRPRGTAPSDRS
jgi:hypothetical protein